MTTQAPGSGVFQPESERLTVRDPRITVMPDAAGIFDPEQPWLARVLQPLVSIDLSAVNPSWSGQIHLVSPIEPEEGLLGDSTSEDHNEYVTANWISFRVDADGRYRFLGDRQYFLIEAAEAWVAEDPEDEIPESLTQHYADVVMQFERTRARYERVGELVYSSRADPDQQDPETWSTTDTAIERVGGRAGGGNWRNYEPPSAFVLADEEMEDGDPTTPTLRLADGRPFTFVADTPGYPWRKYGADGILLFFEPETRTAVLTFEWT